MDVVTLRLPQRYPSVSASFGSFGPTHSAGPPFLKVMGRPTFLVAEPMPNEGISARKLVLEAARYNVITGYSAADALELLRRFPKVDGVIVHAGIGDRDFHQVIDEASASNSDRLIILLSPGQHSSHKAAHYHLSSHDPKQLLELLIERFGIPS